MNSKQRRMFWIRSLKYFHSCDGEALSSCSRPRPKAFKRWNENRNADLICDISLFPTQCPSPVVATGQSWLHPSAISLSALHSFLKASKAFMAFLSYPFLLHPTSSEILWPCLSHAVNTNITWVKILKSCSQYKVSESLSITFTTFKKSPQKHSLGKKTFSTSWFFPCTEHNSRLNLQGSLSRNLVVHTIAFTLTPILPNMYVT